MSLNPQVTDRSRSQRLSQRACSGVTTAAKGVRAVGRVAKKSLCRNGSALYRHTRNSWNVLTNSDFRLKRARVPETARTIRIKTNV